MAKVFIVDGLKHILVEIGFFKAMGFSVAQTAERNDVLNYVLTLATPVDVM